MRTPPRPPPPVHCLLRLFVAGATTRSHQALLRVRALYAAELAAGGQLEVIDIYQQPALARRHQIVATPTLIMEFPRPIRRSIGTFADPADLLPAPPPLPNAQPTRPHPA